MIDIYDPKTDIRELKLFVAERFMREREAEIIDLDWVSGEHRLDLVALERYHGAPLRRSAWDAVDAAEDEAQENGGMDADEIQEEIQEEFDDAARSEREHLDAAYAEAAYEEELNEGDMSYALLAQFPAPRVDWAAAMRGEGDFSWDDEEEESEDEIIIADGDLIIVFASVLFQTSMEAGFKPLSSEGEIRALMEEAALQYLWEHEDLRALPTRFDDIEMLPVTRDSVMIRHHSRKVLLELKF